MDVEFIPVGDAALLVRLGETIELALNRRLHALVRRLQQAALPGVEECVPAYAALMVVYDPLLLSATQVQGRVQAISGIISYWLRGYGDPPPQLILSYEWGESR